MSKVSGVVLLALVAGCGSGTSAEECAPGDASRPDVICSPAGKWIARTETAQAGSDDGQQSSSGGSGSQSTSTGAGGSATQTASAGTGGSGSGGSAASGGSGGAGGSPATGGSAEASGNAGAGGSAALGTCLSAGTLNCSTITPCCACAMCVTDSTNVGCAALCTDGSQCNSGCCVTLSDGSASVCASTDACGAAPQPAPAQTYTLSAIDRVATNFYKARSGATELVIKTSLCLALTTRNDGLLIQTLMAASSSTSTTGQAMPVT